MKKVSYYIPLLLFLVLAIFFSIQLLTQKDPSELPSVFIEKKLPNITLDPFEDYEFLSQDIGYVNLRGVTQGLFYSPYAATSLREYFANGFENFHIKKDYNYLQIMSPVLYNKIQNLLDKV